MWLSNLIAISKPVLFEFVRVFFDRFGVLELLEARVILHEVWQILQLVLSRLCRDRIDRV